jgi:hypothetical protein
VPGDWSDGWRLALDAGFGEMERKSNAQKREFPLYFSLLAGNMRQSMVRSRLRPPPTNLQLFFSLPILVQS